MSVVSCVTSSDPPGVGVLGSEALSVACFGAAPAVGVGALIAIVAGEAGGAGQV